MVLLAVTVVVGPVRVTVLGHFLVVVNVLVTVAAKASPAKNARRIAPSFMAVRW